MSLRAETISEHARHGVCGGCGGCTEVLPGRCGVCSDVRVVHVGEEAWGCPAPRSACGQGHLGPAG